MLKAVTFDFWNTLYPPLGHDRGAGPTELRTRILRDMLLEQGREFSLEQARAAYDHAEQELFEHWQTDMRCTSPEQAVERMLGFLGVELEPARAAELVERFVHRDQLGRVAPFAGVEEMLAELADRFRLGVVSDTWLTPGAFIREMMAGHGILDRFTATVFSNETGWLKPHPRQFRIALEALDAEPEETVHVGDSEWRDVSGARQLGMKTVLVSWDQDAKQSQADAVVSGLAKLPEVLAGLDS